MESMILTQSDLLIIGAALRYWHDENGHDPNLLQFYTDAPVNSSSGTDDEGELANRLLQTDLRYLIYRQPSLRLKNAECYLSAEAAMKEATGPEEIVATVLVANSR